MCQIWQVDLIALWYPILQSQSKHYQALQLWLTTYTIKCSILKFTVAYQSHVIIEMHKTKITVTESYHYIRFPAFFNAVMKHKMDVKKHRSSKENIRALGKHSYIWEVKKCVKQQENEICCKFIRLCLRWVQLFL